MRGRCAGRSTQSHPGGGAGLLLPSWWNVYYCVSVVYLGTMTACHHLRGGILLVRFCPPRMSPTPRSAKYGVTHSCHRLRGGIMGAPIGGPRMSPTPRSAKYGVTHGCNPSRGRGNVRLWSSAPRGGRGVRCLHRGADAALRPVLRCIGSAWVGLWAQKNRCLSIDSK